MDRFKAAIFDLDGVIVNTAEYHYMAWKRLAEELGFELKEEDNERLKGVSRMKSLDILLSMADIKIDDEQRLALADMKNKWYLEYINKIGPEEILPGALDLITSIRAKGIKTALASASKNAPLILDKLKIRYLFDAVVDGNLISKAKPDPEIFLTAAMMLNVEPSKCIVFEDALAGVEAAHRAGMFVVGIGGNHTLDQADYAVDDIRKAVHILE